MEKCNGLGFRVLCYCDGFSGTISRKLTKYSKCFSDSLGMKVPAYLYFIKDEVYKKIC